MLIMTEDIKVGDLQAALGSRSVGLQGIDLSGERVEIPIFITNGAQAGPTLAVTAGIHGAEYASIAAALQLGQSLQPAHLKGRVIVAPVVNMPAFRARSIYVCPLDGVNLNRVFPGNSDGTASEQLAHWLFQNVIKQADYYVDLHGGDLIESLVPFTVYSHTGKAAVDAKSLELAKSFGISRIVRSESQGGTYAAAAQAGIPAILTESGGQGIWLPEHVEAHVDGLNRLMRDLGMLEGPAPEPVQTHVLDQFPWLRSEQDGYYYPKVKVGETVHKGQDVGCVTDFEGRVLQSLSAPANGEVLFLVTSLAINKGDPLLAVGA
jgi:predicted deacylase